MTPLAQYIGAYVATVLDAEPDADVLVIHGPLAPREVQFRIYLGENKFVAGQRVEDLEHVGNAGQYGEHMASEALALLRGSL